MAAFNYQYLSAENQQNHIAFHCMLTDYPLLLTVYTGYKGGHGRYYLLLRNNRDEALTDDVYDLSTQYNCNRDFPANR